MLPDKVLTPLHKHLREPDTPDVQAIITAFEKGGYYLANQDSEKLSFRDKPWSPKQKFYTFILWVIISVSLIYTGYALPQESQLGIFLLALSAACIGLPFMYGLLLLTTYRYEYQIHLTGHKDIRYRPLDSKLMAFLKRFTAFSWIFFGGLVTSILAYVFGYLLGIIDILMK